MKNKDFLGLLHAQRHPSGRKWTIEKLATAISGNRGHVNDVLNNKPGHGGQTRRKLAALFQKDFPSWRAMLATLGWDESGNLVPQGTSDVQQNS